MDKRTVIVIAIVAVCVIGVIVGFVCLSNQGHGSGTISTSGGQSGQGLSFEDDQEKQTKFIPTVAMPGWTSLSIPANTTDVEVDFFNPESNAGKYHMTFELILDDTGESLYKSGLIRAGDHVRYITLSRPLAAGKYNATIHIQPYSADEALTAKNNANVSLKLIVS